MVYNDYEMKLWRLALDPGAMKGEIDNSAVKLIESFRKRNLKPEDLGVPPVVASVDWGSTICPFKKWRGKTISEIALSEPDYLAWIIDWIENGDEELQQKFRFFVVAINNFYRGGR